MSTGHASTSFFTSARSFATAGSTFTSMKRPATLRPPELLADQDRDLLDALRHRDPGRLHPRDLLRGRVFLALDDRARVAEAHDLHLVHEAARHEGDDREARAVLLHPLRELGLHAAAGLG